MNSRLHLKLVFSLAAILEMTEMWGKRCVTLFFRREEVFPTGCHVTLFLFQRGGVAIALLVQKMGTITQTFMALYLKVLNTEMVFIYLIAR